MVCRGLYFDELERIVNARNSQLRESAQTKKEGTRRGKSKAVYIERRV
jgi:hypothetical protein